MCEKEITKELVEERMNSALSYFPWGGKVIAVRQNEWGEWIVDCKIPGHYQLESDGYRGRIYHLEDADCPICQFMVVLEYQESRYGMEPWWLTRYFAAKDNKRLPTGMEEGLTTLDPYAPPSPYIIEPIKAYIEAHKDDPNPF